MIDYYQLAEDAIRAIVFHSPTTFSWFGEQTARIPLRIRRLITPEAARSYLLFNVQTKLYSQFYCQGFATPARDSMFGSTIGRTPFVEKLSAANMGLGFWQDGWEVRSLRDRGVVARRDHVDISVEWKDCSAKSELTEPGTQVSLYLSKERLKTSPGFYLALGNIDIPFENPGQMMRIYWNLIAEGAPHLMSTVTSMLNQAQRPFRLKVLNHPARYIRCDAGVLYIQKSDYNNLVGILEEIHAELAPNLKQGIPVFTKPLAPGIGLAEDPGDGESFGLHRSKLFAEGLIRAYEQGKISLDERLEMVVGSFSESGINFVQPYLNPKSSDTYQFHSRSGKALKPSEDKRSYPRSAVDAYTFLQTAAKIGQYLSRQAVWHQDQCNWIGAEPSVHGLVPGQPGITYRALGPDLYSGTSGVAWFLAELYRVTGETFARQTALGAMAHALSQINGLPPASSLGLYTGHLGIAFAVARVGWILAEEELLKKAIDLAKGSIDNHHDQHEFDLLSGIAGAIVTLLVLQEITHEGFFLEYAARLGDELLQRAEKTDIGYSWKSVATDKNRRNLTGFSHGTAGVAYALLELFDATGDVKFHEAVEQAFRYERHWFDPSVGNWPDFREVARQSKRREALSFATSWCHGAPGIALSRLRAYMILKDEVYKDEAVTALSTTQKAIETVLFAGTGNFSLCHGLAGNAEIVLYGQRVLGLGQANGSAVAHQVARSGIERYAQSGLSWPCGTGTGESPGLMLGLAGIGYFYLRLANPNPPSPLVLQRQDYFDSVQV